MNGYQFEGGRKKASWPAQEASACRNVQYQRAAPPLGVNAGVYRSVWKPRARAECTRLTVRSLSCPSSAHPVLCTLQVQSSANTRPGRDWRLQQAQRTLKGGSRGHTCLCSSRIRVSCVLNSRRHWFTTLCRKINKNNLFKIIFSRN